MEKSHLSVELIKPSETLMVHNDRQRLLQVLNNLLDNAIKFTSKGFIRFGCRDYGPAKLLFFVSDTGVGIPREKYGIIFQRFRQAEENLTRKFGGNGLGLAISKPLVQLMGGSIWFESQEEVGSTFYFTIDKVLGKEELIKNSKIKNKRVLVVEDDRHSYDYFKILLEQFGGTVMCARSGNEALSLIESGIEIDTILMDIQLEDISGIEVTKSIRKINLNIPIIAQTAYAREEDRQNCLNAGCNDFIAKPVDDDVLIRIISKYL
jgi:CheY-like chemotaxis protein